MMLVSEQKRGLTFFEFDAEYYGRLRGGDAETERHFVSYFAPLLLAKLRKRIRSAALVEDIRQETFLRAFRVIRSVEGLREPSRLGAFVNRICDNTMLEFLRGDSRAEAMDDAAEQLPSSQVSPESEAITQERKRMVRSAIEELPERDRRILRMVFLEEQDKDDVCQEFGVGRDHLRVLVHRAKLHFVQVLKARSAGATA
jgi:RNA polymerase sigma-70 factor, ECF subfamily